jgi:hypothetical protein
MAGSAASMTAMVLASHSPTDDPAGDRVYAA